MDFLQEFFERRGTRHPQRHDEHGWHSARPHRDEAHDDPRYEHVSEHEHGEHHAPYGDPHGRSTLPGVLGALAQPKTLLVVAALLLLVVVIGGVVVLVWLLPMVGKLLTVVSSTDFTGRFTDLLRLLTTPLVDVPKTVLEYLAPLLQLKSALEGKA